MKNKYYMHKDAMDVCFKIVSMYKGSMEYKLKGYWVNLGYCGTPYIIEPKTCWIKVAVDDFKNWYDITDQIYSPRKKPGLPQKDAK